MANPFYCNRVDVVALEVFLANPLPLAVKINNGNLLKRQARKLRWKVFERDNYTCVSCGLVGVKVVSWKEFGSEVIHYDLTGIKDDEDIMFSLDHVIPKSRGGLSTMENLDCMCAPCNYRKGSKIPIECYS